MGKSDTAFRTISEVAGELDIPQHVLRFWEGRFNQIKPLKRAGGRRYYRPEDVELIKRIRDLLYSQGYTIKGVQKLLRDKVQTGADKPQAALGKPVQPALLEAPKQSAKPGEQLSLLAPPSPTGGKSDANGLLAQLLDELLEMRAQLRKAGV